MYIAIEGVIGVGKTTLARLLQPSFDSELLLEIFEENPFLSDFYRSFIRTAHAMRFKHKFSFCSAAITSSAKVSLMH